MNSNRRHFLVSSVAGAGGLSVLNAAGAPAGGDETVVEFDQQWQSYVDSGIYPPRTHLFLDDHYVGEMERVRRVVQFPTKVKDQPVLDNENPWEGVSMVFRNSIIRDDHDRLFKIWYRGYDPGLKSVSHSRWCYAVSPDGIHWERPELGLVEYDGSKKNNMVSFSRSSDHNALLHNVVRDDRDPNPARRFKAIGTDAHPVQDGDIEVPYLRKTGFRTAGGLFAAYSPDGVNWTMRPGWLAGMFLKAGIDYALTEITDGPTGRDFASRSGSASQDQTWRGSLRPHGGLVLRIIPKE